MSMITLFFSLVGLPWVCIAVPHSPFHARNLATIEVIYHPNGMIEEKDRSSQETRITGFISSLFVALSVLMIPMPLQLIPVPVLYGVFVYLSVTELPANHFWERLKLIITQRNLYPPSSYLRKVPLRVIHSFTIFQAICVLWLVFWGLTPIDYVRSPGPAIFTIIPIRRWIGGLLFDEKYLKYLDPKVIGA